jgi:hypothetical protein
LCRCAGQLVAPFSRGEGRRWSGHSIGGFVTGLMPGGERVERLALVGTHTGYWRDYARRVRLPMFFTWHLAMPLIVRAIGYMPARRFGLPEDLPAGVARDWSARRKPEPWWNLKRPDGSADRERIAGVIARFDAFRAERWSSRSPTIRSRRARRQPASRRYSATARSTRGASTRAPRDCRTSATSASSARACARRCGRWSGTSWSGKG